MGFSEDEKVFIKEIIFEAYPYFIQQHIDSCPWGKKMVKFIWVGVGIGITLSLLGITTIPAMLHLMGMK
jgi:hypothetical protein